jgi:hypothetical protein
VSSAARARGLVHVLALAGSLLFADLAETATAQDTRARIVLIEPRSVPARAPGAVTTRLRAELETLGIAAQVTRARSDAPQYELASLAQSEDAPTAAALVPGHEAATLWIAQSGTGSLSVHILERTQSDASATWAVQAAELLRPALLGIESYARAPAAEPDSAHGSARTAPDDEELPPGLVVHRDSPPAASRQARLTTELGVGILSSPNVTSPGPALSVLLGLNITRMLRIELLALAPLGASVSQQEGATARVRASLFGVHLRTALLERPRGDMAFGCGAALAVVAYTPGAELDAAEAWTRDTEPSMYARLGGGMKLAHALTLRADLSLGTLIDGVRLSTSDAPAPFWGRLWLAGVFGLAATFL